MALARVNRGRAGLTHARSQLWALRPLARYGSAALSRPSYSLSARVAPQGFNKPKPIMGPYFPVPNSRSRGAGLRLFSWWLSLTEKAGQEREPCISPARRDDSLP